MTDDFQVSGQNAAALFTLKIHRGEGMALLAMNWKKDKPSNDFVGFAPPFTSDPSYSRLDLAWTYRVSKRFSYVGIITNALDRRYMEALGFPALPIAFRTGGRFTF